MGQKRKQRLSAEVGAAISLFGADLQRVKSISCDMAAGYLLVCSEQLPRARVAINKFHVMQYVYDAVLDVRRRIKKELSSGLTRGKGNFSPRHCEGGTPEAISRK